MAISATPGRPFADIGDADSRPTVEEVRAAADQAESLSRDPKKLRRQQESINDLLTARRGEVQEGLLSPTRARFAQIRDHTEQPLQVLTEILVRTSDFKGEGSRFHSTPMRDVLNGLGLEPSPVAELQDRVTRLTNPDIDAEGLAGIAADLRAAGYQASMNQVLPLGYVTKSVVGAVGPEPVNRAIKPNFPVGPRPLGLSDVVVAVIDTGITDQVRTDQWLANIVAGPADIDPLYEVSRAGLPTSEIFDFSAGHGTFVTGVVQQVAPFSTILVRRAIGRDGIGNDVDVGIAMWQAVEQKGATILNLSLGSETPDDSPPLATLVALELIAESGIDVVVVAAAGNSQGIRPVYPAAFSAMSGIGVPVVSVAGLTMSNKPAPFSTHGFWVTCSTPGQCVLSTFAAGQETPDMDPAPDSWVLPDPWAIWTGTSFAAPQVAGAIARRCQESGDPPSVALSWLLAQGVDLPDYGKALEILRIADRP
jgi:Subtilase family